MTTKRGQKIEKQQEKDRTHCHGGEKKNKKEDYNTYNIRKMTNEEKTKYPALEFEKINENGEEDNCTPNVSTLYIFYLVICQKEIT